MSLLQVSNAAVNRDDIGNRHNTTPMKSFDCTYWSLPCVGQILIVLSPNTLWDSYLSYVNNEWKIEAGPTPMEIGKGYIIRTPKDNGGVA